MTMSMRMKLARRTGRNTKETTFFTFFFSIYRESLMSTESDLIRRKHAFGNLFMKHGAVQGGFVSHGSTQARRLCHYGFFILNFCRTQKKLH